MEMKTDHFAPNFAEMFLALGSAARLDIVRLLIRAGQQGLTVGQIQSELNIPNSTLSHHLEKLRIEGLLNMQKDRQWLWYSVNLESIGKLVAFLCARCYSAELVGPLLNQIQNECGGKKKGEKKCKRIAKKSKTSAPRPSPKSWVARESLS
jgi:DNA-binding transcriptional ArsR family regulator